MDGFDFGSFAQQIGDAVANIKGYDNVQDLAIESSAKNLARLTSGPGADVKQTPPTLAPTAYTMELLGEKKYFGLSQLQLLAIAGVGAVIVVVALRRK
jgi:hypothetical protein